VTGGSLSLMMSSLHPMSFSKLCECFFFFFFFLHKFFFTLESCANYYWAVEQHNIWVGRGGCSLKSEL
jgi:hypothetical protein